MSPFIYWLNIHSTMETGCHDDRSHSQQYSSSSGNPVIVFRPVVEAMEYSIHRHPIIAHLLLTHIPLKAISAEFQVIRGFSQKIPADLLSYDKIHS